MFRLCSLTILVAIFLTAPLSQGADKKDADNKKDNGGLREAELKFADGSAVRVLLLQDNVDIVTKFGKLSIPINDVKRIEFGVHTSDEVAKKIEDAIRRFGSDTFTQREAAGKDLINIGAAALPALKAASKSPDQEIAQRARASMDRIKERVPAAQLRLKVEDFIQTSEFPVQGRIVISTFKVRTAYFGDLDLKVADLRSLRLTAGGGLDALEVTVDAARYSIQDMTQWMDTGITADGDTALSIAASGQVSLRQGGGGQFLTGPAGSIQFQRNNGTLYPPGALLAKIGENGNIFVVGERFESNQKLEGKLFLQIAPSPWGDNMCSGSFKLKINGGKKEANGDE
jgi:hypothetical protein